MRTRSSRRASGADRRLTASDTWSDRQAGGARTTPPPGASCLISPSSLSPLSSLTSLFTSTPTRDKASVQVFELLPALCAVLQQAQQSALLRRHSAFLCPHLGTSISVIFGGRHFSSLRAKNENHGLLSKKII